MTAALSRKLNCVFAAILLSGLILIYGAPSAKAYETGLHRLSLDLTQGLLASVCLAGLAGLSWLIIWGTGKLAAIQNDKD